MAKHAVSEEDRIATLHGTESMETNPDPMQGLEVLTSLDVAGPQPAD